MKILILILFFSQLAIAKKELIDVTVKGMVCSFCTQGLLKRAKENPKIEDVNISLEKKNMRLLIKEKQTFSDEEIQKLVSEGGKLEVKNISRDFEK